MDKENKAMEEFVCGDSKGYIRVGDEYQAEIPPMMSESKYAALDFDSDRLPVEVMMIETKSRDDNVDMNESLKSLKTNKSRRRGMKLEIFPEKASSSWEDLEVDGFVLGLYTFGKNFTQVKKLLERKETGDLLSFYYRKFYKSAKHKVWSYSIKKKSRKCIQGKKIYSGWRLQQLLSRLIPAITDELQKNKLVNISKSFAEGHTSLENYIISVKELVGLQSLVEAVAIGKDKEDLTVRRTEPVKSKQWFTVSSPVAAGMGAYTSLTSDEIIEQLTGGSRLSKARSNDIFWEAVWPRLLARGWHSEQPKDRGYIKDYIVFLIPGVKKFSRRKLVKHNHYFDSISDILTKVSSEPELLEFQTAEIRAPNGYIEDNICDQTDQVKHRYFGFCKNPNPSQKHAKFADERKWERRLMKKLVDDPMRFMIVDTSLDHGEQSSGLRRWRHLPGDENIRRDMPGDSVICEYPKGTYSGLKEETLEQGRSNKRFVRKSESKNHRSVSSLPLPKRRRLSACVRKDINRSGESLVSKQPALDQKTKCYPKLSVDSSRQQQEPNGLCSMSVSDMQCSSKKQEALNELSSSEQESIRLCSDKNCSSMDIETAQKQEQTIQIPTMSGSEKKSPSTQEVAPLEQEHKEQRNTDVPRRQSTRKRPLTTRAMEALESKPIKRKRSTRIKHSTNASNRTQGESDNGFLPNQTTSKPLDQIEDLEPSFLVNKATTASKPVDQPEDSTNVTAELPKRPRIVFKLPFKRS